MTHDEILDAARIALSNAFPKSAWRTCPAKGGQVVGRHGYMTVELSVVDGMWVGDAHASTYKPADVADFFISATGATPAEVVGKLAAQV